MEEDKKMIPTENQKPLAATSPRNERYETVSVFLGRFQVIIYLALFAYVVLTLVSNAKLLTYRNFYYFFKDLNASTKSVDFLETDSVSYHTDPSQCFTLFRGGLAVAGNSSVTVFSATGREAICKNVSYQNPTAVGSGKYLVVYELGGKQYSVYNSYAQLKADRCEYPISGVSVSDSGMYAMISSDSEYLSVVSLYSDNFSLIAKYSRNDLVTDVAINSKGTHIAIMSTSVKDGKYLTEISFYEPQKRELSKTVEIDGHIGLSCCYTESGAVAVLCSDAVLFVQPNGKIGNEFDFSGEIIVASHLQKDGAIVCLKDAENSFANRLILLDKNGKTRYDTTIDASVLDAGFAGSDIFILCSDSVVKIQIEKNEITEQSHQISNPRMLIASENSIFICSPQKSTFFKF